MLTTFGPSLIWDPLSFVVNDGKFLGLVGGPPAAWNSFRICVHFVGRFVIVLICFLQPVLRLMVRLSTGEGTSFFSWLHNRMTFQTIEVNGRTLYELNTFELSYEIFKAFIFITAPYAIHGVIFYMFSQVSHAQAECAHEPLQNDQGIQGSKNKTDVSREWATHQVKSTVDWGVGSILWLYLSLGLNLQTVHHLYPQVVTACCTHPYNMLIVLCAYMI